MAITPAQSRAARALLNISQPELAALSGASVSTIRDFETGKRSPIANNLTAIKAALEAAGIAFLAEGDLAAGPGVAKRAQV
ncbi:helix-turn-helix domain-containing protein [Neorhizobium galegae]|uniref:helix-turn-helix domain-containing protein n=1 Tax=Neorhizobium galegae TaxID=399 RepID=UPI001AE83C63|nr:helix-turn-helix transcriptional regulator [Neorhizobium galegae]